MNNINNLGNNSVVTLQWWAVWLTPKPTERMNHDTYETEYEETGMAELTIVKASSIEEAVWVAEERFYKRYRDSFVVVQYRMAKNEDFIKYKRGNRWISIGSIFARS